MKLNIEFIGLPSEEGSDDKYWELSELNLGSSVISKLSMGISSPVSAYSMLLLVQRHEK